MEKIFNNSNYRTIDNGSVTFRTPKRVQSGVDFSRIVYTLEGERVKLSFETDVFVLQNGINRTKNGQYVVDIQIDENQQAFSEFVGEMDELALGKLWENSKKWFGEQLDQDILDSFYKYPFRTNTTGGSYMRVPLDMENLVVRNQNGTQMNLEQIEKGSRVKVKATLEGMEFYKQLVLPVYRITGITVYVNNKKVNDGYSFYTYDNNLPDLVRDDLDNGLETDAEELATFHDKNEREVKAMLGIKEEEVGVEELDDNLDETEETRIEPRDNLNTQEETREEGEDGQEEENLDGSEEGREENLDAPEEGRDENLGNGQEELGEQETENLGELVENNDLEGEKLFNDDDNLEGETLGEVETVERTVEETERDDISEILSKNLTKALDEGEKTLEIYEDDTLEDKELKLRRAIELLKREKTGTQQSDVSSDSRRSKRKVILRYNKKRVVNQAL